MVTQVRLRTTLPWRAGWRHSQTRPWCQLNPAEAQAVPIPLGQVCVRPEDWEVLLRTQTDCESSPDREHQGERSSVKLLCSRQVSLPDFIADPSSDGERSVPVIPEPGATRAQVTWPSPAWPTVALCTCPSAAAYSEICHQREVPGVNSAPFECLVVSRPLVRGQGLGHGYGCKCE